MSVAIAPQAHAQTTTPAAPPVAAPVDPVVPEELGLATDPDDSTVADSCPRFYICLYQHSFFHGRMVKFRDYGSSDLRRFPYFFNDMTSSVKNKTPFRWCVYQHKNYGGHRAYARANKLYPTINPWWNDRISSIRQAGPQGQC